VFAHVDLFFTGVAAAEPSTRSRRVPARNGAAHLRAVCCGATTAILPVTWREQCGDGLKPWGPLYCISYENSSWVWMFFLVEMVVVGVDPEPYRHARCDKFHWFHWSVQAFLDNDHHNIKVM